MAVATALAAALLARSAFKNWLRGERWYTFVYRAFYRVGLRVWGRETPPADLVKLVEGPGALRPAVRSTSAAARGRTASISRSMAGQ